MAFHAPGVEYGRDIARVCGRRNSGRGEREQQAQGAHKVRVARRKRRSKGEKTLLKKFRQNVERTQPRPSSV